MSTQFCCPRCGNADLQITTETNIQTTGSNYSAGKGCLGYLLLGPLGLLCGSCGQSQQTTSTSTNYWICPKCGKKFENPDDLRKKIEEMSHGIKACNIMIIISIIVGLILIYSYSRLLSTGVFILVLPLLCFFNLVFRIQRKQIENELQNIEEGMQRFKK